MEKTKGWKTSEFWTMVLTSLGMIINQSGLFKFQIPLDAIHQAVQVAGVYIGGRSVIKAAAAYGAYAAAKLAAGNVQPAQNSTINK